MAPISSPVLRETEQFHCRVDFIEPYSPLRLHFRFITDYSSACAQGPRERLQKRDETMTQQPLKKTPYRAPKLTEHGTIRSMTNTNPAGSGDNDASGPGNYVS